MKIVGNLSEMSDTEAAAYMCFVKKMFAKFTEKHLKRPEACNFFKKETPTQVFSGEFCEIFKNTIFINTSGGCHCR